ncbi:MAG: helix-turn-helix transcriptional regulator [Ruminococcus sp.]|nr:helix-turn-helix transcriptional regulator [Ruminococcus sp.]
MWEMNFVYFSRLRDLREDKDMNQTEVAKLLFTSQTVYSRYERGALTIPVEHLLILADFYGVSTDYILGRTNRKEAYPE